MTDLWLFLGFCLLILTGCSKSPEAQCMDLLAQMEGEWEFTGTEIREEWTKVNEKSYHVDVISYAGWEPEIAQTIDLTWVDNALVYKGEIGRAHNSTRPIRFRSSAIGTDFILFENQVQEFPQHIQYSLIHRDKIRVKLSGSQDGRYREQEFVYYRFGTEHSAGS